MSPAFPALLWSAVSAPQALAIQTLCKVFARRNQPDSLLASFPVAQRSSKIEGAVSSTGGYSLRLQMNERCPGPDKGRAHSSWKRTVTLNPAEHTSKNVQKHYGVSGVPPATSHFRPPPSLIHSFIHYAGAELHRTFQPQHY